MYIFMILKTQCGPNNFAMAQKIKIEPLTLYHFFHSQLSFCCLVSSNHADNTKCMKCHTLS